MGSDLHPTWGIWACRSPSSRCYRTISRARTRSSLGCGTAYASAWMARRGARRRHRQLRSAARHGTAHAASARTRLLRSCTETPRRFRCRMRSFGFPRSLRVRRVPLGRSAPVGARGRASGCAPAAASCFRQLVPRGALHAGRGRNRRHRPAGRRPAFGLYRLHFPATSASNSILARRLDPTLAPVAFRNRRPDRSMALRKCLDPISVRHHRLGAAMARRRGVESPQNTLAMRVPRRRFLPWRFAIEEVDPVTRLASSLAIAPAHRRSTGAGGPLADRSGTRHRRGAYVGRARAVGARTSCAVATLAPAVAKIVAPDAASTPPPCSMTVEAAPR